MQRVHPTAFRRRIVHAGVVDVGEQDSEREHELLPVVGAQRQQATCNRVGEVDDPGRDVARVDDPVIRVERRVQAGLRHDPSVARDRFERRVLLDRAPEPLLENRPEVPGEAALDRAGRESLFRCGGDDAGRVQTLSLPGVRVSIDRVYAGGGFAVTRRTRSRIS